jgi:hypothetical protein
VTAAVQKLRSRILADDLDALLNNLVAQLGARYVDLVDG